MAKQFDILIVEDEQVVSNVANRILMSAGFNVDMVYDDIISYTKYTSFPG